MPLLNRQMQIPGGLRFYQPEIKWSSPPWASFEVIVQGLIAARNAHPALLQKHNWNIDYGKVAQEVDDFNTRLCQVNGWKNYITAGGGGQPSPPPFLPPATPTDPGKLAAAAESVKAIWAGVRTINDWGDAGYPAVPSQQSESRAATCVACPKNGSGDWTSWFTRPAAEAIKRQAELFQQKKLTTSQDEKLQVCTACWCPLRLKVHAPMEFVTKHLNQETITKLKEGKDCWILREMAG